MKQLLRGLLFSLVASSGLSCVTQSYVVATSPNVNLRRAPNVTAPVVINPFE